MMNKKDKIILLCLVFFFFLSIVFGIMREYRKKEINPVNSNVEVMLP
jgi:preprotein translocase subunit SecG